MTDQANDPLITQTDNEEWARTAEEAGECDFNGIKYVVTGVYEMAETPGRARPMWSVHGHPAEE
jgi:hypothetical protein